MKRLSLTMSTLAVAWIAGCASAPAPISLADTAARTPELSTLNKLINEAGLAETLRETGPFTFFAPSDAAFKALPVKTVDELAKDKLRLKAVLTYHMLPGKVAAADIKQGNAKTIYGTEVALAKSGTFVTYDEAVVTQPDIAASNGVLHIIDKVIVPALPRP